MNHKIFGFLMAFAILLYIFQEVLRVNFMIFLIISRGIIAPNQFWWSVSDLLLRDGSGVHLYRQIKDRVGDRKIVPLNFMGYRMHLILDHNMIQQVLDQSPLVFGVGKLKYNFFSSFMSKNVGVSQGDVWVHRRIMNEKVLESDQIHNLAQLWYSDIKHLLELHGIPTKFADFKLLGQMITMKIVFGQPIQMDNQPIVNDIFKVFSLANSVSAIFGKDLSGSPTVQAYLNYLREQIANPRKNSLVEIGTLVESSTDELIHQIPHWIFPTIGQVIMSLPRILLLLINHPPIFQKLLDELQKANQIGGLKSIQDVHGIKYLRYCILETLRLNNPVVTTFRTLLSDYSFGTKNDLQNNYRKGDLFVILNNPILRSREFWVDPDQYIPERWNQSGLEKSYYAIMFNQGPQKCPGKELALIVIESFLVQILSQSGLMDGKRKITATPSISTKEIPQMINPYSITLNFF